MAQLLLGFGVAWALQQKYKEMSLLHTASVEAAHAEHRAESVSKPAQGQVATSTSIRRMQQTEMKDDIERLNSDMPKSERQALLQSNAHLQQQQSSFDSRQAGTSRAPMQGVMLDYYKF